MKSIMITMQAAARFIRIGKEDADSFSLSYMMKQPASCWLRFPQKDNCPTHSSYNDQSSSLSTTALGVLEENESHNQDG